VKNEGTIGSLIDAIYDVGLDAGRWPFVLQRLAESFGSSSAHLSVDVTGCGGIGADAAPRMISFGTAPTYSRSYADYYAARNILWDRIVARSLSGIVTNRMIMPTEEARRSEFYNDYLRPQEGDEILCAVAARQGRVGTCFTLWRPERFGPWQPQDVMMLTALAPHLQRAIRLNERIGAIQMASGLAADVLYSLNYGVILVDAQASVYFTNRAAEGALAAKAFRLDNNRLHAQRTSDSNLLHRLIARAARHGYGDSLVLSRRERPPLLVWVIPLRPENWPLKWNRSGAMLLIRDMERIAERSLHAFCGHFGLTSAEQAVARELIKGDGVNAVATRLAVRSATVRTHLLRIFQKTGTGRQAELVRFILEWTDGSQLLSGHRLV
jgi:DNA-binding CsgD family transcriptional regulator